MSPLTATPPAKLPDHDARNGYRTAESTSTASSGSRAIASAKRRQRRAELQAREHIIGLLEEEAPAGTADVQPSSQSAPSAAAQNRPIRPGLTDARHAADDHQGDRCSRGRRSARGTASRTSRRRRPGRPACRARWSRGRESHLRARPGCRDHPTSSRGSKTVAVFSSPLASHATLSSPSRFFDPAGRPVRTERRWVCPASWRTDVSGFAVEQVVAEGRPHHRRAAQRRACRSRRRPGPPSGSRTAGLVDGPAFRRS